MHLHGLFHGPVLLPGQSERITRANIKDLAGPYTMHPVTTERLTKVLVKVTVQGSVGPVQLVMSPETSVVALMKAVLEVYTQHKRRPVMAQITPSCFELHYSPFSFESLDEDEQLINLGSRSFFMCQKTTCNSNEETCSDPKNTRNFHFSAIEMLMDILL
ncbi:hypothetical protein KSS87_013050 [Heliosperma pusillum]|nr:hypothetical protein KSS87_013050 [Heliosperma pusillum]